MMKVQSNTQYYAGHLFRQIEFQKKGRRVNGPTSCKLESSTTPFVPVPPWVALVIIVDTMFAINTNPLRQHKTVEQYAYLLFKQYAVPHFCRGRQEVHFVFDHPGRHQFNPKDCEHRRRYGKSDTEHTHIQLKPQSPIPRPW